MSFTVEVKEKPLEIKFGYGMLFKANKKLGSKDKDGKSQNDGAGILFMQVLEEEDDALINVINLAHKGDLSENEVLKAIENYISKYDDEEEGYSAIFENLKEEMLESGFFVKKLKKYISNLEKAAEAIKKQKPSETIEDPKAQAEALTEIAERMKKELSSSTAQDKD